MKAHGLSKMHNPTHSSREKRVAGYSNFESLTNSEITSCVRIPTHTASMELILPQVIDAIVVCDDQGLIVLANVGAKQLAQVDPEGKPLELAQNIWGELFDFSGCHIAPEEWTIMSDLRGETTSHKECRLVRPDGGASDMFCTATSGRSRSRRVIGA